MKSFRKKSKPSWLNKALWNIVPHKATSTDTSTVQSLGDFNDQFTLQQWKAPFQLKWLPGYCIFGLKSSTRHFLSLHYCTNSTRPEVHSWLPLQWPCRTLRSVMCWGRCDPAPERHKHLYAPKPPADAPCKVNMGKKWGTCDTFRYIHDTGNAATHCISELCLMMLTVKWCLYK